MAEILPKQRKLLYNQSINQSIKSLGARFSETDIVYMYLLLDSSNCFALQLLLKSSFGYKTRIGVTFLSLIWIRGTSVILAIECSI